MHSIYICILIQLRTHIYIHTQFDTMTDGYVCIYVHTHIQFHKYVTIRIRMHAVRMRIHMYLRTHIYAHAQFDTVTNALAIHTQIHIHIYTYTYALYTYTYKHMF